MRIISIITITAVMATVAGCGPSRKTTSGAEETSTAAAKEQPAPDTVPEIAPFGNAALAGKEDAESEAASHVWDFRDATTWLLGDISPERLAEPPHASWYLEGYANYNPDPECLEQLRKTDISNITVTVVLGTWCPDSRREVPRFMKLADLWGFPKEKIRFIGVDINKVAPLDEYASLGIERVPTFIFFENNLEKGRIIEIPISSLEQDSRDILEGKY